MYKQDVSVVKHSSREIILSELYRNRTKKVEHAVTLPNKNFFVEQALLKRDGDCKINSFEYDKSVYKQAIKLKPRVVKLINGDIFDHDFKQVPQDFVWLDLCNSYSENIINKIIEFTSKLRFAPGSLYAITLNKKRGRASSEIEFNWFYPNYKQKGVANHIGNFIHGVVNEVKHVEYSCYDINPRGASMSVFMFKIN